jgi:hypothetical protein
MPERPGFEPIAGGEPGPLGQYVWYWSPVYGWLLGVPVPGAEPPKPEMPPAVPGKAASAPADDDSDE